MLSPGDAAVTAADIEDIQPCLPPGFTHKVAAKVEAPYRDNRATPMRHRTALRWICPSRMVVGFRNMNSSVWNAAVERRDDGLSGGFRPAMIVVSLLVRHKLINP